MPTCLPASSESIWQPWADERCIHLPDNCFPSPTYKSATFQENTVSRAESAATISISAFNNSPALAASNRAVRLSATRSRAATSASTYSVQITKLSSWSCNGRQPFLHRMLHHNRFLGEARAKHDHLQSISCALVLRSKLEKPRKPECWTRPSRLGPAKWHAVHRYAMLVMRFQMPPRDQPNIR